MFLCFDTMERGAPRPSQALRVVRPVGARHPQTILAHGLNGERLPTPNGTPLRVRLKLQLGDKMAKDIRAIEVTDTLRPYGERAGGLGGPWLQLVCGHPVVKI
ncbi:molybdopterin-dependent oxidoreductase [Microvirga sp. BT688]|nr:molybdopterin-dependent oxidoreductase [Microvirga sp.]